MIEDSKNIGDKNNISETSIVLKHKTLKKRYKYNNKANRDKHINDMFNFNFDYDKAYMPPNKLIENKSENRQSNHEIYKILLEYYSSEEKKLKKMKIQQKFFFYRKYIRGW